MIASGLAVSEVPDIERILTEKKERDFFARSELRGDRTPARLIHLAGMLAAKKAFFHALGKRTCRLLSRVEVVRAASGKPAFRITGDVLRRALGSRRVSVSISHTKTLAVAFCLIYAKDSGKGETRETVDER